MRIRNALDRDHPREELPGRPLPQLVVVVDRDQRDTGTRSVVQMRLRSLDRVIRHSRMQMEYG